LEEKNFPFTLLKIRLIAIQSIPIRSKVMAGKFPVLKRYSDVNGLIKTQSRNALAGLINAITSSNDKNAFIAKSIILM